MLKKLDEKMIMALSVVTMLIAAWLFSAAYSVWQERQLLCGSLRQEQTLLAKRQQFAAGHADYDSYQKQQEAKLTQLQTQAEEQLQLNNVIQRLQKQARTQGVELVALHAGQVQRRKEEQLKLQQLKIVAVGDYFTLLRWLRQVERAGCWIKQIRLMQGAQDKAKLTMELNVELQITN